MGRLVEEVVNLSICSLRMATKKTTTKKPSTTRTKAAASAKKAGRKRPATVAKKTTTRVAKKAAKKKALPVAPPHQAFWVSDGAILHSLPELAAALAVMSKETYQHHVTKDKHDFALWVEEVLEHKTLAAALRKAKTTKTASRAVDKVLQS